SAREPRFLQHGAGNSPNYPTSVLGCRTDRTRYRAWIATSTDVLRRVCASVVDGTNLSYPDHEVCRRPSGGRNRCRSGVSHGLGRRCCPVPATCLHRARGKKPYSLRLLTVVVGGRRCRVYVCPPTWSVRTRSWPGSPPVSW